jgi:hypothetical protein
MFRRGESPKAPLARETMGEIRAFFAYKEETFIKRNP